MNIEDQGEVLDSDPEDFRRAAHAAVDWIADYFQNRERLPVLSQWQPGDLDPRFESAEGEGRSMTSMLDDFREHIIPGITHWNHPAFFAYFAVTGSQAGILGELLSSALNINGMVWRSSPVATELETAVLARLRRALGLPDGWFGIINDTASVNSFLGLAAAREATGLNIRTEGMTGRTMPQLRIYCSDQAHSSIDKAALALGLGIRSLRKIETDEAFAMKPEALADAIAQDRRDGVLPCAIVASVGTTSTTAVDPVDEIRKIAAREKVWLHVDAAYAGSAMIDPQYRHFWRGVEEADSVVVNPHKWLFTPIDCSVLYTRRPEMLKETFSLVPDYLKTAEESQVINYMDYGIQLGRRFRALKLWMVLEHYGLEKLRRVIAQHIRFAERLEGELRARPDIEILAPRNFSVVAFRKVVRNGQEIDEVASERATEALMEAMNRSGEVFLSQTRLRGKYAIRVAIGNGATTWEHVARILNFV
jgi:aromatic-L-amino-acid decarboxylase